MTHNKRARSFFNQLFLLLSAHLPVSKHPSYFSFLDKAAIFRSRELDFCFLRWLILFGKGKELEEIKTSGHARSVLIGTTAKTSWQKCPKSRSWSSSSSAPQSSAFYGQRVSAADIVTL